MPSKIAELRSPIRRFYDILVGRELRRDIKRNLQRLGENLAYRNMVPLGPHGINPADARLKIEAVNPDQINFYSTGAQFGSTSATRETQDAVQNIIKAKDPRIEKTKVNKGLLAAAYLIPALVGGLLSISAIATIAFQVLPLATLLGVSSTAAGILMTGLNVLAGLGVGLVTHITAWGIKHRSAKKAYQKTADAVTKLDPEELAKALYAEKRAGNDIQKVLNLFGNHFLTTRSSLIDALTWLEAGQIALENIQNGQTVDIGKLLKDLKTRFDALEQLERQNMKQYEITQELGRAIGTLNGIKSANALLAKAVQILVDIRSGQKIDIAPLIADIDKQLGTLDQNLKVAKDLQQVKSDLASAIKPSQPPVPQPVPPPAPFPQPAPQVPAPTPSHPSIPPTPPVPNFEGESSSYTLLRKIGAGGMGEVYLARNIANNELVAIKFLPFDTAHAIAKKRFPNQPDEIKKEIIAAICRFNSEFVMGRPLSHPAIAKAVDTNVSKVFDIADLSRLFRTETTDDVKKEILRKFNLGTALNNRIFIVTQFVPKEPGSEEPGKPIGNYIKGILPGQAVRNLFLPVLDALREAHSLGVYHRDLKPDNLLVMEEHGEAKVSIVDFGIAKDRNRATQLTRITDAAGSPQYMPPVVYQIEAKNDNSKYALVDIYEMGIVFYELLTGKNPFAQMDENTYKQFLAKPESIPLDFSEIRESDMLAVVRKMMSNRPQDNFQSMQEVIDALEGKVKLAPPVVAPVGYKAPAPAPAPAAPGDSTRLSGLSTVQDALPMDGIDIDKREQVIDYLSALQKELAKRSSLDKGDYLLIDAHLGRILEKYAADEDILDILGMIQIKLTRFIGKGGVK